LKQLDNILNHYLPSGLTQAVEQLISKIRKKQLQQLRDNWLLLPHRKRMLADAVKYAQAELAQAKATYETGRRHCEEIAAAIEKINYRSTASKTSTEKMMSILSQHLQKFATLNPERD